MAVILWQMNTCISKNWLLPTPNNRQPYNVQSFFFFSLASLLLLEESVNHDSLMKRFLKIEGKFMKGYSCRVFAMCHH